MPRETLPADIADAIDFIIDEAKFAGGRHSRDDGEDIRKARAALSDAILSHLNGRAEEERVLRAIAEGSV